MAGGQLVEARCISWAMYVNNKRDVLASIFQKVSVSVWVLGYAYALIITDV